MTAPSTDALLEHAGFLRGLARSLLRDDHRAEDVVQDALVAAWRKPPGRPALLRAWLAAVTRNLAMRERRADARRLRRERAAARPEGLAPAADVAARVEVQRRVAEAVRDLEEPYRSAIVHRYFDDLSPTEIARRAGVPVRTVETRLRRGRERLRARLDTACGTRRAWCLALLPLLELERTAGASLAAGAAFMTAKTTFALTAVLVAGGFVAGWAVRPVSGGGESRVVRRAADSGTDLPALRTELDATRASLRARETRNAELEEEVASLRAELAQVRAARPEEADADPLSAKEPRFAYDGFQDALNSVDWAQAGESIVNIQPLIAKLAEALAAGGPIPPEVGELQRWNGPLVTAALKLQQKGLGEQPNDAFTHPSALVNLVHATLAHADAPLDGAQQEALYQAGLRALQEDEARRGRYTEDTYALARKLEETALKAKLLREVDGLLTPDQRARLHPAGDGSDRLQTDLFSTGIVWLQHAQPLTYSSREDLQESVARRVASRFGIQDRAAVDAVVGEWLAGFPQGYFDEPGTPLDEHGMLRVDRVRVAAERQLELLRALSGRLSLPPETVQRIRNETGVIVPVRKG